MKFKDLPVGSTFDFIDDNNPSRATFMKPCKKTSARWYVATIHPFSSYQVGSINVEVFHVSLAKPGDKEQCNLCTGRGVKFASRAYGKQGVQSSNCPRCQGSGQVPVENKNPMPKAFVKKKKEWVI